MLIGNKLDLEEDREIRQEEAKTFAEFHSMDEVLETSAKVCIPSDSAVLTTWLLLYAALDMKSFLFL